MKIFLAILFILVVVLKESQAVRGALFRSGRAVPFERVPGQQKSAPVCREVELFVPCLFTINRNCVIDKICVHEAPVPLKTTPIVIPVTTPNSKREESLQNLMGSPRRNDFLRFGRAVMASGVGGGSDAGQGVLQDEKYGEPETVYQ